MITDTFRKYSNSSKAFTFGFCVLIIILLPYVLLGENAFITIHDFLDSGVAHVSTVLTLKGTNYDGMLPVLDGVPSTLYVSLVPVDVKIILYSLLPAYWAIVCNILFVKYSAFVGMYLLCRSYLLSGNCLQSCIVAICFSLIPFYADLELSSAGIPLLLYALLNMKNGVHFFFSYFLVFLFACNSSFVLVGFFVCFFLALVIFYMWWKKDKAYVHIVYALSILMVIYLYSNLSIIITLLFPSGIISHRAEFNNNLPFLLVIQNWRDILRNSQYHAGRFMALPIVVVSFFVMFSKRLTDRSVKYYAFAYVLFVLLILLGSLLKYTGMGIFTSFQFDRYYFFYPTLCFVIFAKALSLVRVKYKIFTTFIMMGLAFFSTLPCDYEIRSNIKRLAGLVVDDYPSYRQFYDKNLFNQIHNDLKIPNDYTCKVVSCGIYPSVAEYNKFYTLDSYVVSYSLEYKHKFRKVIEKELDKSEMLKSYFDNWGSRCYTFSSELGNQFLCSKKDKTIVEHLELNTKILKELGCQYILSAIDIKNYEDMNLSYVNTYSTPESYWIIRVYRLN